MGIAAGRFGEQKIDPGLGQYLGLMVQVGLSLGFRGFGPSLGVVAFVGDPNAEARDRAGDQHRTVLGRLVAGVLGQGDGAYIELRNLVDEAEGLQVMARRGVGVGGDDVGAGGDILLVHAAHGGGVALKRRRRPGKARHRHAHGLKPAADGAVEHDDFAVRYAPLKVRIFTHVSVPPIIRILSGDTLSRHSPDDI